VGRACSGKRATTHGVHRSKYKTKCATTFAHSNRCWSGTLRELPNGRARGDSGPPTFDRSMDCCVCPEEGMAIIISVVSNPVSLLRDGVIS
jgi:hypothetical protein